MISDPKARITVEIERALLRQVKAKAALQDTTISDVVRLALRSYVAEDGCHPNPRPRARTVDSAV